MMIDTLIQGWLPTALIVIGGAAFYQQ